MTKTLQPRKDHTDNHTMTPAKHLISNIKIIPKKIANPADAITITQVF